jgi:hypothetical protein
MQSRWLALGLVTASSVFVACAKPVDEKDMTAMKTWSQDVCACAEKKEPDAAVACPDKFKMPSSPFGSGTKYTEESSKAWDGLQNVGLECMQKIARAKAATSASP